MGVAFSLNDIASVVLSWALGDGGYERKEKVEPFGLLVDFFSCTGWLESSILS